MWAYACIYVHTYILCVCSRSRCKLNSVLLRCLISFVSGPSLSLSGLNSFFRLTRLFHLAPVLLRLSLLSFVCVLCCLCGRRQFVFGIRLRGGIRLRVGMRLREFVFGIRLREGIRLRGEFVFEQLVFGIRLRNSSSSAGRNVIPAPRPQCI